MRSGPLQLAPLFLLVCLMLAVVGDCFSANVVAAGRPLVLKLLPN